MEMKGTGNLFYLFINNGFDKIVGVQDFEPLPALIHHQIFRSL